ncbi:MAG: alpha-glucan family phosphorylase [Bacteroidetes bacterium]|nr:alpha-glucan family phosphorylase [Bacteroidota bacterium]
MEEITDKPDYLFEISWEVCNKVGGIHTVISTKAPTISKELRDNYFVIGPDVWREDYFENPEFEEDESLFASWKLQARQEGLVFRTGRWKIEGRPLAIIVDFTPYIPDKDKIFSRFWEFCRLDSLSGQWDYIEPALFGYAAGKIIESFVRYNLTIRDKVIAHFHEWMAGTGILYIKEHVPQVATVFTTHATVIGRCLAGNGFPLYDNLHEYNGDLKATEFNVVAKQSAEKQSAMKADCFTTVSEITAGECAQFLGKNVDIVTPNGFDDSFVPQGDEFVLKRNAARKKLLNVASALMDTQFNDSVMLVNISGRYEFRNKGIDLFIDSLAKLNSSGELKREIIAYLLIPANNYGPRKDLLKKSGNKKDSNPLNGSILTHNLHDAEYDPILKRLKGYGLSNSPDSKVKVIFVPSYLNGSDGIFDMSYYDILIGMDLTVFPSYYEPWGYTPLESLAFHIPTITTTLAGFGAWVKNSFNRPQEGIEVIRRSDTNDFEVVDGIVQKIINCSGKNENEIIKTRRNAFEISRIALWRNLTVHYFGAYKTALGKLHERSDTITELKRQELAPERHDKIRGIKPDWKKVFVEKNIPAGLKGLEELANNLWWSWNEDAVSLFASVEQDLWISCDGNPLRMLEEISYERLQSLEKDSAFTERYHAVLKKFRDYLAKSEKKPGEMIAYFSMEYGIHDSLKIYSGGLGMLAGDYLKEASDCNINLVGVGLLYRHGYFKQEISLYGEQVVSYPPQKFSQLPAYPVRNEDGKILSVTVALPGRNLTARIWRADVGRIPLYLLDADHPENQEQDRTITHQLYGGDWENRFKQEMLLGVGGIRVLAILGIKPYIYHSNEGHAAFSGLERLRRLINLKNLTFSEAHEIVKATTVFTTHTPVAAGHDSFQEDMLRTYMGHYPDRLKISWEEFMELGKVNPKDKNERFSLSHLAANLSREINGVSWLHGEVTKKLLNPLWEGYYPNELHIGYVTNGVHYSTWIAPKWKALHEQVFGKVFFSDLSNKEHWSKIYKVPDENIWKIRQEQRSELIAYIKERYRSNRIKRHDNPKRIVEVLGKINENYLTIGFARRFATYKRAHLLFSNTDRLAKIVSDPNRPVQFLFAGKAHPNDKAGQDIIKFITQISQKPEFTGRILFLENYDIELAKKLIQGVDVWLNTPTRPLEASGTSGMKAVLNGVLHFSVLDGWWVEGYKPDAGWAIQEKRTYDDQLLQDELDAEIIYGILENEIIPLFYDRDKQGIPEGWIRFIKNSIANIAPEFTTKRMLDDYIRKFYNPLFESRNRIREDEYRLAYELAKWKKQVTRAWDGISVSSVDMLDPSKMTLKVGEKYNADIEVFLNGLSTDDIGMELVSADINEEGTVLATQNAEFSLVKSSDNRAWYTISISPSKSGILNYGVRIYPKNASLPHRQDLGLVKWI